MPARLAILGAAPYAARGFVFNKPSDIFSILGGEMFWNRHKKLGVAVTCADWRLHQRRVDLNTRLARQLRVGGVDVTAVPGPDGLLRPERAGEWQAVRDWAKLLVTAHHAEALAVVAHQKCAGHPVSDTEHDHDVVEVAKALKAAIGFGGPTQALVAIFHNDAKWGLKLVARV